jgi:hypothetical protein
MTFQYTSSMALSTLAWNATKENMISTDHSRMRIRKVGMTWQEVASEGTASELLSAGSFAGSPDQLKVNHVNEITGLMGSAGEQITLAWTAEQDVQRWNQTKEQRDKFHTRMGVRALAELATHFCLGATHNLGNTVLRVMLLHDTASAYLADKNRKKDFVFAPGSEARYAWTTVSPSNVKFRAQLKEAARLTQAAPCQALADVVDVLCTDSAFIALDERRGTDFHRHRPQSLDTGSPRDGAWQTTPSGHWRSLQWHVASPDPAADENLVASTVAAGLEAVADAFEAAYPLIIESIAALGYRISLLP